jgi:hypothetical protein
MDKYYTPSLDEFYVGFEYEVVLPQWYIQEFRNTIVGTNEDLDAINNCIKLNRIFVKYLDKEDIEELGFVLEYIPNCYTEDDEIQLGHSLRIDEDTSILLHCIFSKNTLKDGVLTPCNIIQVGITRQHVYNKNTGNWEITHLFLGEIKNKSELKKLLKQLGIE